MLRVTFFSYKGGVGRTLALLNVAAELARNGRKVVAVDLDLEAPGFGLSSLTVPDGGEPRLGVSDFIFATRVPGALDVARYVVPAAVPDLAENLLLMPAGTRATELAGRIGDFYRDPAGDSANAFQVLTAEIAQRLRPDYLFFDSRTGYADVAGVCTIELPDVLVVLSGLNEQSVQGTAGILRSLRDHQARVERTATLVVLSPVPREADLGLLPTLRAASRRAETGGVVIETERQSNMLVDAFERAKTSLLPIVTEEFQEARKRFPRLQQRDLLQWLEYDPEVPIRDELHVFRGCRLAEQYRSLARAISLAHPSDDILAGAAESQLPDWSDALS